MPINLKQSFLMHKTECLVFSSLKFISLCTPSHEDSQTKLLICRSTTTAKCGMLIDAHSPRTH